MRIGNHKEYPIWFHGHLRTICGAITTLIAMLIVTYIIVVPLEVNYYGDSVVFLQGISFWVSLQRVCRPAVDKSRRKCPPRYWLPVFDVCIGLLWSAYVAMQCYYQVDYITITHNATCSTVEIGTYVAATIFVLLSAFCHYQTYMMLEETQPLRPQYPRQPLVDEIQLPDRPLLEEQAFPEGEYGSWYQYGMIDEKEVIEGCAEGVTTGSDLEGQIEGAEEEKDGKVNSPGGSSSSSSSSSGPAGEGMCPICMDKPQNAVCIPCGHTAGCFACLLRNQKQNRPCPICRAKVRQVVKLHRV